MAYEVRRPENWETTWATLIHLSPLLGYLLPVPGVTLLAPLVFWLLKRNESRFVDLQGKEALNFNLTYVLLLLLAGGFLLAGVFSAFTQRDPTGGGALPVVWIGLSVLFAMAVFVAHLVLMVLAAVRASNGSDFRYPFTLRLIG